MGTDGVVVASQLLEGGQFAHAEAVVHHKSHAYRQLVFPHDGILQPAEVLDLHVVGVTVVARRVLVGEEGLAGILRPYQSCLHVVAVVELVAQPVAVGVAEIAVVVAFSLIKRYTHVCHSLVPSVLQDVFHGWVRFLVFFFHKGEVAQQGYLDVVQ